MLLASSAMQICHAWLATVALLGTAAAQASQTDQEPQTHQASQTDQASQTFQTSQRDQTLPTYIVVGDAIPASLTGMAGDVARGRALVADRASTCILCHSGPFPEQKFQGDLAPSLSAAGSRWSEGQLRLRLVDASRLNPATIMPSYFRVEGLDRVGTAWRGKPILSAEQIEDMVAYLATMRE